MPVFVCGFVCLLHLLKRRIASPAHVLVRFRLFRPPLSCRAIHPTKNSHAGWLATGLLLFPNNSSSATKKSVNINLMVYVIFFYWVCWVVFMRFIFGTKFPSGWTSGVVDTVWFPKFPRFSWAGAPKIQFFQTFLIFISQFEKVAPYRSSGVSNERTRAHYGCIAKANQYIYLSIIHGSTNTFDTNTNKKNPRSTNAFYPQ